MKNSFFTSISARILATSILPTIFACLALTLFYLEKRTDESREFLVNRGEQLAREVAGLSEFALISGSSEYLDDAISILVDEPEIFSIAIFDNKGKLFLHKQSVLNIQNNRPQNLMTFESPAYRMIENIKTFDIGEDLNLDTGIERHDNLQRHRLVGYVTIRISTSALQEKRSEIILYGILLAFSVLLVSTLIGLLYSTSLLTAIRRIVSSVRNIRKGNYDSPINSRSTNELGDLSNNIDSLADELKMSKEEIGRKIIELIDARESADRANAAKSIFLARVSHELRDPLTAVVGNLEILLNTDTSEYQGRAICLAEKNAEFLLRQIDDILEFSLLESGQYSIEMHYFNISEITDLVANIMEPKATQKGLTFSIHVNVDPELRSCHIESDPIRIQQILINLIANAIKFTHSGSIDTQVFLRRVQDGRNQAALEVHVLDTGIGIAREHINTIFEMFEQVQPPISRQYGGAGLGLSITKHIVEALGGCITVKSTLHEGSRFSVEIKTRFISSEEAYKMTPTKNDDNLTDIKDSKILLIEDSVDNQRVVTAFLQNIGISVDIASHGLEGLEKFQKHKYDIVFVDCFMPHMDGFEFTRRVREHEAQYWGGSKALLIGLTAGAHKQNIERCYACGMDDVITKPFYRIDIYKRLLGFKNAQRMLEKMKRG